MDCAQGPPQPIIEIERFQSEAQSLAGQLVIPRHDGIRIAHIKSDTGGGYLLLFVERSERRPHRCESAGEKQYFKRAGDNTFAMEHYDIEDAFRRVVSPIITLFWKPQRGGDHATMNGIVSTVYFELGLINSGSTMVRFPFLQIRPGRGFGSSTIPLTPGNGEFSRQAL